MQNAFKKRQEPSECILPEINIKYILTEAASPGNLA